MKILTINLILFFSINANAQVASANFEFNGKHIFIKVLTGKSDTLRYVFDTGATNASIDSAAAEKAGISKENLEMVNVAGNGGSQAYYMAKDQTFYVAGLKIEGVNPTVMNLAGFRQQTGMKMDGLIGYEILNQYVTKIDFDKKQLSFYQKIKDVATKGYTAIPFEFNKGILIPRFSLTITLSSGEIFTGRVMFDSGGGFNLLVSAPYNKFHQISEKLKDKSIKESRGVNAISREEYAAIKTMSFNGFDLGAMGIDLTINENAEAKDGYLGMIGIDIIKRFNVILDYANKMIYLQPNKLFEQAKEEEKQKSNFVATNKTFLEKNKTKEGIKETASGLQYKIIKEGTGSKPLASDKVTLHFNFSLADGRKMGEGYTIKNPWIHHIDKALPGMQEALTLMPQGSKWILYMPANLAFGEEGYEDFPPGAVVICEIELVDIKK